MVVCECKYIRIQVHNSMVYFLNGIEISKQEKKTSLHWSKQWMKSSNMNGKRTMKLFRIVYSRRMCIPMAISNGFRWTNLFADDAYVISYQLMYIYSELNMCDQRIYGCYTIIYTDKYIQIVQNIHNRHQQIHAHAWSALTLTCVGICYWFWIMNTHYNMLDTNNTCIRVFVQNLFHFHHMNRQC